MLRDLWRDEEGSVTIEAALSMSTLVLVVVVMLGALATLGAYLAAVDTAGAAARAKAIGVDFSPPRGSVSYSESAGLITATAHIPAPLRQVTASAVFPKEQSEQAAAG